MIQHYCAYQERSQKEVRNKLYENGANKNEVDNLMILLIQENFLNEERYAQSY
ncbi:MAG: RecX family transcriptional regulator, partial [Chitinophagaceae bacterium]|nr:RecX family transcriptional regulator [Chitinophagaceae bacterium]